MLSPLLEMRGRDGAAGASPRDCVEGALRRPVSRKPGPLHIAYLANSPVPTKAANCVHVMKMCNAFQRAGHRTTLLAERSGRDSVDEARLFDDFGVSPFGVCLLDTLAGSLAMEAERIEEALRERQPISSDAR